MKDMRDSALRLVIGHVKNGYGMKTATVVADKEVTIWVKQCIENELQKNGAVLENASTSNIIVDVLVCYAQAYERYGAEVKGKVSVSSAGNEIFKDREYSGKDILGMNWAATSKSYQEVLELAMKDFLQKLLPDIERSLLSKT